MPELLSDEDLRNLQGEVVPRSFKAGYVVLSYFISYIGAFTTIEIIMRRTASRGWYNLFLLVAGSISMGGISIWCMHFVGNCAIVLGDGQEQLQLDISGGFTTLSFFTPIAVLFIAFGVVGSDESSIFRVVLGGVLAGLGICGMHFLGQAGIANYDCIYDVGAFVGAAVIAIVASVVALVIFFIFRYAWKSSLWKRGLVALILASAVSGMHWLASVGTSYRYKFTGPGSFAVSYMATAVVVVIVLSIVCCMILFFLTLLEQARYRRLEKEAEQVVLATATFDSHGKLLVTHEGLLPTKKIANSWLEKSMDDVFGVAHPVFLWIFRTSRNWYAVSGLISGMRYHIRNTGVKGRLRSLDESALFTEEGTPINDYSAIFRELFCIAAADLADDLRHPVEKLGVLYDEVVTTGLAAKAAEKGRKSTATAASSMLDVERDVDSSLGKGQLLFLVRKVNGHEADALQAHGFRFSDPEIVVTSLAKSLRVGPRGLARRLNIMRHYAGDHHMLDPGVHLGCFAIRASMAVGNRGFDILVRKDAKNQLPAMQSPISTLETWQIEYLETMDSQSMSVCVKQLYKAMKPNNKNVQQREFAKNLLQTIEALKDEMGDPLFVDSLLIAKPFDVPCRGPTDHSAPGIASLIAFRMILPLHSRAPGRKLTFTPLSLFQAQQRVYRNSPDNAFFARTIHREFAPMLDVERISGTFNETNSVTRKLTSDIARWSRSSRSSRHDVGMGEHVDMYGNALPDSSSEYRGPAKIRFWDKTPHTRRMGEHSSEQNLIGLGPGSGMSGHQKDHRDGVDTGHEASSRPCSVGSPRPGDPEPGTQMQMLDPDYHKREPSTPRPVQEKEKESKIYVDELFRLTIAKRQVG
ncbi:hypothetical protein LZ554_007379 [Drepanopeziza brunnea f. sp. 'monogermtubi']|nr:hypothetical protein LZ554_007379 [Drepanopeziza brunnea f. sp. 'monogermtubi']